MPKPTTNKKIVASAGGRKISTPVGLLFIVGGALLLTVAGTFGYAKYKERDLQTKAARWKTVTPWKQIKGNDDGVKFVACREYTVIGPDAQQNKPIKVSVLASKPKTLGPATQSGYKDRAILYPGVYKPVTKKAAKTGWPDVTVYQDTGGTTATFWWNNELTSASIDNVRTNYKLAPYVISKAGNVSSATNNDLFKNSYTVKYVTPPSPQSYATVKDYQTALKTWQKAAMSVAQLPNCK